MTDSFSPSPNLMPSMHTQHPSQPVDHEIRHQALDPQGSFAVAAPAGSGKTGLLTQRVLILLAASEQPEEVLAITFTRKAAGEMQDRIMHALWRAADTPEPSDPHARHTWQLAQRVLERDNELGWNLLQSPQRLRIQTIDSLCRSITKQLPLASGIGAQPDTLENPEPAYRQAVREFQHEWLEKDSPIQNDLIRLYKHVDNNQNAIENLLVSLLAKREQWLGALIQARNDNARDYLETVLVDVIEEHLQHVHNALAPLASEICAIADAAARNLEDEGEKKNRIHELLGITYLPSTTPDDVRTWLALCDLLLTQTGSFRSRLTKAEGFPAGKPFAHLKEQFVELVSHLNDTAPHVHEFLHEVRQLPPARYNDNQWDLLESLTRILPVLAAQLLLVFKQLHATDYTAISQAAIDALGDEDSPSDLALLLDYRIRHILVDEFQDTASPQLHLLQQLISGWQDRDGRTLFIVGDGMQSCYGFRNANVGLFLDARQQGIGDIALTPLDLSVNFRSQAGVVNWVNDVFEHAFPRKHDISRGAVAYSPSSAFKPAIHDNAVTTYACFYETDQDDDSEHPAKLLAQWREAEHVAELTEKALHDNQTDTIAILVRTRSHLKAILPELSRKHIRFHATDLDRLSSRMSIIDIHSLTRALLNPADRIAWLSILRAPWCGLGNADLHQLVTYPLHDISARKGDRFSIIWSLLKSHSDIPGLTQDAHIILQRVVSVLELALTQRHRKTLRTWIEGVWLALGGPATVTEKKDFANITAYFGLLDKFESGGGIRDWTDFEKALESLFAAPDAPVGTRVHVMTIHKSKGLEFDTVIIPGLDRDTRADDKQLLLWQERLNQHGERQLLLGPLAAVGSDDDALYRYLKVEQDKQHSFEATRLLYVGCTRAIKSLHLLGCIRVKKDEPQAPRKRSLLYSIWPQVKSTLTPLSVNAANTEHADKKSYQLLRLIPAWQIPPLPRNELLSAYRGHDIAELEADALNPLNLPILEAQPSRLARHLGTVIHNTLQAIVENQWISSTSTRATADILSNQRQQWRQQLVALGWKGDLLDAALHRINHSIEVTLTSSAGQWLLNSDHEESVSEVSLIEQGKAEVREFIIDRTFVDNGIRWIIDYKSSEPESDESLEHFFSREIALYKEQLVRYAGLYRKIESRPIKTALFFTAIGEFVEVTA
jgi:ATP-dependent helicase/nuclease subunit A